MCHQLKHLHCFNSSIHHIKDIRIESQFYIFVENSILHVITTLSQKQFVSKLKFKQTTDLSFCGSNSVVHYRAPKLPGNGDTFSKHFFPK